MLTFAAHAVSALLSVCLMAGARGAPEAVSHLEYVVVTGAIYVYDMDNGFTLVKTLALSPTERTNIKGVAASPASGMLYVSYGGDGGADGFGSLLKYDLRTDQILWARQYSHGVDSMALNADASLLYMLGGDGGADGFGSLLKYDLRTDQILWARQYSHGVDSMALNADASLLYMPVG